MAFVQESGVHSEEEVELPVVVRGAEATDRLVVDEIILDEEDRVDDGVKAAPPPRPAADARRIAALLGVILIVE